METLRTPDERFANLADYDYEPHYVEIPDTEGDTLRVHYVDTGAGSSEETVLLLHGEPSWGYLYRHMVPPLAAAGHRVIVPDQVGFGRSDKPTQRSDYTYARHVEWMSSAIFDQLGLDNITFFGQDWGGLIGLRLVAAKPERFKRVAIGNAFLPDGSAKPSKAFLAWQNFSQTVEDFNVGFIIDGATTTELSDEIKAGYDAPFPDDSFKAGARVWPMLVPTSPDDPAVPANLAAWEVLERFEQPFLCCFSDGDPVTGGLDEIFKARVPGTAGQAHTTIEGASHFLQEDKGAELAQVLNDFIAATR